MKKIISIITGLLLASSSMVFAAPATTHLYNTFTFIFNQELNDPMTIHYQSCDKSTCSSTIQTATITPNSYISIPLLPADKDNYVFITSVDVAGSSINMDSHECKAVTGSSNAIELRTRPGMIICKSIIVATN